jgi:hypothetical protein
MVTVMEMVTVQFIPSIALFPIPLKLFQQVLMFYICIETINYLLPTLFFYSSPATSTLLLTFVLHYCSSFFKCMFFVQWGFALVFHL